MLTEKNRIIYIVAGILALFSWWLVYLSSPKEVAGIAIAEHTADYLSTGYLKRELDIYGMLKSEVKAEKMLHYGDDGSVELHHPVLSFFRRNSKPWIIKSESGLLINQGKELQLNGFVYASKAAMPGSRGISISTSDLRVYPETSYAETAKWAELKSSPDITTGIGMQLKYSDPIHITLLNKVQGKYEIH